MRKIVTFLFLVLYSCLVFANLNLITWKGTYYDGIPNKKGITRTYCKEHTPGTFIHVVKDVLAHPIITDKNVKFSHSTFNIDKVGGIYLMHGDILATGNLKGVPWHEHIHYYIYKFSEAGITRGVW